MFHSGHRVPKWSHQYIPILMQGLTAMIVAYLWPKWSPLALRRFIVSRKISEHNSFVGNDLKK
jgi:hypothetical protein